MEGGGAAIARQRRSSGFCSDSRRFLFQTCMGSGPTAPFLPPDLKDFNPLSLNPPVDFATSRGRDACCSEELEELAEEDITTPSQRWVAFYQR